MAYIGQAPTKVPLTSADIADGTIALADMAVNSVDSDQYVDGSIDLAHIATNQIDETLLKDALVGDFTDATVTASDYFLHGDATDSGNTKKDTIQGILDLVGGGTDYAVVRAARNMDAASGNQDITGMGFDPAACMVMVGADATHQAEASWGWTDFSANGCLYSIHNATADTFKFYYIPVAEMEDGATTRQVASITQITDGVRLAWVKGGTTDTFTMTTTVLGFK